MKLSQLHLLLTYQCTYECDHCFVWSSPWLTNTMTLDSIRNILEQARSLGTVGWIYFEGGEPFLYYPVMVKAIQETVDRQFRAGIVTNGYWATSLEDALLWLNPVAGAIGDLSISCDSYHGNDESRERARTAIAAAKKLGIPASDIVIAEPESPDAQAGIGQIAPGDSAVMYRGRAADTLVDRASKKPWRQFTECPHEELGEPKRVHVDPYGNLHLCQGISIGNMFRRPLADICKEYDPEANPIVGPLLEGGPVRLARRYNTPHADRYADACHLCYETRRQLRTQFSAILTPEQMYGIATE